MSKAIIGLDIDGVVCNTCEAVIDYYNKLSGDNLKLEDLHSYYLKDSVRPEWRENINDIFGMKDFWKTVHIYEDSKEYINKLIDDDFRIVFVTSSEPYNFFKKSYWLRDMFPKINIADSFVAISDKQLLSGIDVLVDDFPENLIDRNDLYGNKLTANYKKIIFNRDGRYSWTKSFVCDNKNSFVSHNFSEVYDIVHKLF